jgi:hypothetical protein
MCVKLIIASFPRTVMVWHHANEDGNGKLMVRHTDDRCGKVEKPAR